MRNPTDNEIKSEDTKKQSEGKSKSDRTNKVQIKPDSYLPDKSKQGELKDTQEGKSKLERTIKVRTKPGSYLPAGKTPRDLKNFDDLSDANKYMVRSLEREKQMLQGQIRDIEWRLDQESKAYHKANEERKNYSLEINSTKGSINELATRSKLNSSRDQLDTIPGSRTPRSMGNIPEDQRILDPKRGPIRKAAAVKSLPSLETT